MKKTVLIGHRWDGRSDKRWLFWLEKKLVEMGFDIQLIELPDLSTDIEDWLPGLESTYGIEKNNVHIVKHDPGCLTILSYLSRLSKQAYDEPTLLIAGQPRVTSKLVFTPKAYLENAGVNNKISNSTPATAQNIQNKYKENLEVALVVIYGGLIPEKLDNKGRKKLFGVQ